MWCSAPKSIDAHATILICLHWLNIFLINNKLLRNLEGGGDKGKEGFLHKSHVIIEYNIAQGWVWSERLYWHIWKLWDKFDPHIKIEGSNHLFCRCYLDERTHTHMMQLLATKKNSNGKSVASQTEHPKFQLYPPDF